MYMYTYNKGPKERPLTTPGTLTLPIGVTSDDYSMQIGIFKDDTQKHISIIGEERDSVLQYILDNLYAVYSHDVLRSCITSRKDATFEKYDALSVCSSIESLNLAIKAHCEMIENYIGFTKCPEVIVLEDLFELQDSVAGTVHDAIRTLFEACKDGNMYCIVTSKCDSLRMLQLMSSINTELVTNSLFGDSDVVISCRRKGRIDQLTVPHYVKSK